MRFSILVPVYNVEKYLHECLESINQQTFSDYEVILVDDGSTDSSGLICDEYESKHKKFKVFHNANHGLMYTRRFALSKATGDYVVNLDSDDMLTSDALETINAKITKYECDCIIYGLKRVQANKELEPYTSRFSEDRLFIDKRSLYLEMFSSQKNNSLCRKAVKRELINKKDFSKYFSVDHGEDLIQSIDIYKNSEKVLLIPECLYIYRMHPNSMIHSQRFENFDLNFTVQKAVLDFLKSEDVFEKEDYECHGIDTINHFATTLVWICSLDDPIKLRKQYLKKVSSSDYIKDYLFNLKYDFNRLGLKSVVFYLFKHRHYTLLLSLTDMMIAIRGNEEK